MRSTAAPFAAVVESTAFVVVLHGPSSVVLLDPLAVAAAFAADNTSVVGSKLVVVAFVPASLDPSREDIGTEAGVGNHNRKALVVASGQEEMLLVDLGPLASDPCYYHQHSNQVHLRHSCPHGLGVLNRLQILPVFLSWSAMVHVHVHVHRE